MGLLVDINLTPEDFKFHSSKVDSNEQLRSKKTKVGNFELSSFLQII